jgi:hypothetical protein
MTLVCNTNVEGSIFNAFTSVSTSSLTIGAGDLVVILAAFNELNTVGTASISNSGTALTWVPIQSVQVSGYVQLFGWYAISPNAENRAVTVAWDSGTAANWAIYNIVATGAHATTPIPQSFKGNSLSNQSRAITPTAAGSALWWLIANSETTGTTVFTLGSGCVAQNSLATDGWDSILVAPSVQPRADTSTFTFAETHPGGNTCAYIAFEIQAAAGAVVSVKRLTVLGAG